MVVWRTGRCGRLKRCQVAFPLPYDLLRSVYLYIGQVLRLDLLDQLSFVVLKFLLIFSRQVLHSRLHDVAWGNIGVILRIIHMGSISTRSHLLSPAESPKNVLAPIWGQTLGAYHLAVLSTTTWMVGDTGPDSPRLCYGSGSPLLAG